MYDLEKMGLSSIDYTLFLKAGLLILVGIVLGWLINILLKKLSERIIFPKIRKSFLEHYRSATSGIKFVRKTLQWIIILLFFLLAMSIFKIFLLDEIIKIFMMFVPKLATSFLIIIIGLFILKIISHKIREFNFDKNEIVTKLFQWIFLFALVLSALEVINIRLTPFLYIFIALLFSCGAAFAIAFGIAFGLGLKPRVENMLKNFKR